MFKIQKNFCAVLNQIASDEACAHDVGRGELIDHAVHENVVWLGRNVAEYLKGEANARFVGRHDAREGEKTVVETFAAPEACSLWCESHAGDNDELRRKEIPPRLRGGMRARGGFHDAKRPSMEVVFAEVTSEDDVVGLNDRKVYFLDSCIFLQEGQRKGFVWQWMIGHDAAGALELWHLLYSGIEGSRAMQAFFDGELAELLAHLTAYGSFFFLCGHGLGFVSLFS